MEHTAPADHPIVRIVLPLEIVDAIIDELHDDPDSLKHCSLVSRQFVSRSQKHLFSFIEFVFPKKPMRAHHPAQRMLDIFRNNPGLARNVNHLHLKSYFEGFWDERAQEYCRVADETLPGLFICLNVLQTFSIDGAWGLTNSRDLTDKRHLNDISPHLTSALFQMFRSTDVADITIENITNFPLGHIASTCPHLKRLSIGDIDSFYPLDDAIIYGSHLTFEDNVHEKLALSTPGRLMTLQIDDRSVHAMEKLYAYTMLPHSHLTLSHVRELTLHGHKLSMREVAATVITDAASSLEEFSWDHNYHVVFADFRYEPINFGKTTRLRILRFAFVHDARFEPIQLFWVSQVLTATRGHNNLEEIILVLNVDLDDVHDDQWRECTEWAPSFDSLLTSPGFDHLRRVSFFIHFTEVDLEGPLPMDEYVTINERLEQRLPRLQEAGLLTVQ
ncbi:hypothetical protein Hypma_005656 [Hypsizygus marmoreus]|uniref:F-box domain-containing protein n=1 Tax=Hypsizygus marmoreus TaxID=39966 RepID=A0A369JW69_HYPMA|nr:hypothetical protein Hypma_005656 [Hypsizygus marmoreus]